MSISPLPPPPEYMTLGYQYLAALKIVVAKMTAAGYDNKLCKDAHKFIEELARSSGRDLEVAANAVIREALNSVLGQ